MNNSTSMKQTADQISVKD